MSSVIIILKGDAFKKFKVKLSAIKKPDKKRCINELLSEARLLVNNKSHDVLIELPSVKYYADDPLYYPEVYFIDRFLNSLPSDEYRFIRLGESGGDYEEAGSYYDNSFCEEYSQKITYRKKNCTALTLE